MENTITESLPQVGRGTRSKSHASTVSLMDSGGGTNAFHKEIIHPENKKKNQASLKIKELRKLHSPLGM